MTTTRASPAAAAPVDEGRACAAGAGWQLAARPGEALVLLPGQMHFGGAAATLSTLLGSCVALSLWHPRLHLGGMCHYLLPTRTRLAGDETDGRYGDEAIAAMVQLLRLAQTEPPEYHARLYGGARALQRAPRAATGIGERNIEQGLRLVRQWGFQLRSVDVGRGVPRAITLTLATGQVAARRSRGRTGTGAPP